MSVTCEFNLYETGRTFKVDELVALRFYPKQDIAKREPEYPELPMLHRPLWIQRLRFAQQFKHPVNWKVIRHCHDNVARRCEIEVAGKVVKFLVTEYGWDAYDDTKPLLVKYSGSVDGVGLDNEELASVNFGPEEFLD